MLTRKQIQDFLLARDNHEDNPWSVWVGAMPATAMQLLNSDGSNPYVRKVQVTNEMLAFDTSLKIATEVYRVTWVSDSDANANASYWLSFDSGVTKNKVAFSHKNSRVKRSYWWLFLKDG